MITISQKLQPDENATPSKSKCSAAYVELNAELWHQNAKIKHNYACSVTSSQRMRPLTAVWYMQLVLQISTYFPCSDRSSGPCRIVPSPNQHRITASDHVLS